MVFFDFVFYFIVYLLGKMWGYEAQKVFPGILLLSLIQLINVIAILNLIIPFRDFSRFDPITIINVLVIFIVFINLLRYYSITTYSKIEKK